MATPLKVLIVDDDPVITAIYEKQFRSRYTVKVAHDPIEGFVALQVFKPDVVLLDLKMPFRSGMDWLTGIRKIEQFRDLPVVVVTGEPADSPLVRSAMQSVATGVLFKSEWDPGAVLAAVAWAATRRAQPQAAA
jgi:CheY-like chemotaxis protein